MNEELNMKTIYRRIKSETPKFWKKIRRLMVACSVIGGGLMAIPKEYVLWMPDNIPGFFLVAGVIGTGLSSLTVTDIKEAEDLNDKA